MKPEELKKEFEWVSSNLVQVITKLNELHDQVSLNMDKQAISEMLTDLRWATENSTVIGLHQVGEALEDNLGTGHKD